MSNANFQDSKKEHISKALYFFPLLILILTIFPIFISCSDTIGELVTKKSESDKYEMRREFLDRTFGHGDSLTIMFKDLSDSTVVEYPYTPDIHYEHFELGIGQYAKFEEITEGNAVLHFWSEDFNLAIVPDGDGSGVDLPTASTRKAFGDIIPTPGVIQGAQEVFIPLTLNIEESVIYFTGELEATENHGKIIVSGKIEDENISMNIYRENGHAILPSPRICISSFAVRDGHVSCSPLHVEWNPEGWPQDAPASASDAVNLLLRRRLLNPEDYGFTLASFKPFQQLSPAFFITCFLSYIEFNAGCWEVSLPYESFYGRDYIYYWFTSPYNHTTFQYLVDSDDSMRLFINPANLFNIKYLGYSRDNVYDTHNEYYPLNTPKMISLAKRFLNEISPYNADGISLRYETFIKESDTYGNVYKAMSIIFADEQLGFRIMRMLCEEALYDSYATHIIETADEYYLGFSPDQFRYLMGLLRDFLNKEDSAKFGISYRDIRENGDWDDGTAYAVYGYAY